MIRFSRWSETRGRLICLLALAMLAMLPGEIAVGEAAWQDAPKPQQAAAPPNASKLRLVRAVAGTKAFERDGLTVIADPRRTFYRPADGQVIAYFEWEGSAGTHHFEGTWKNPQGRALDPVSFDSEAKTERFGASWKLPLSESTRMGIWTLEVRVDGKRAGTQMVNIISPRQPLRIFTHTPVAPAEMHRNALAALVTVQKLGLRGQVLATNFGFFGDNGLVFTAFQAIDGAKSLRLGLPNGRQVDTDEALAWSRREDWAVLKVSDTGTPKLARAPDNSWKIGQRCFYIDSDAGNRIIVDTTISDEATVPQIGPRLAFAQLPGPHAVGAPALNEYGEVIGVLGRIVPGAYSIANERSAYAINVMDAQRFLRDVVAVPISSVFTPAPSTSPTKLEELSRQGLFIPLLEGEENVESGTMARQLQQIGGLAEPTSASFDFTRLDGQAVIIVNWNLRQTLKGNLAMRVYDLDNRMLSENTATKMDGKPGYTFTTGWRFDIGRLAAGIYRVDVGLGNTVMWRSFFRITE